MDKQYIAMCDTPEIQGQWEPKVGDRIYSNILQGIKFVETNIFNSPLKSVMIKNSIWLPRQEDIQEMLTSLYTVDGMLADFDELWNDERWADKDSLAKPYPGVQKGQGIWGIFHTIEQIWLALYIREVHKKTWSGKEWKESR